MGKVPGNGEISRLTPQTFVKEAAYPGVVASRKDSLMAMPSDLKPPRTWCCEHDLVRPKLGLRKPRRPISQRALRKERP